jgi:hypothetical protein
MQDYLSLACRSFALTFLLGMLSACSEDLSSAAGTYAGRLVMEDDSASVELELLADGTARMVGLFGETAEEGTWKMEVVGSGYEKDDVWASFKFPKHRIRLKLKTADKGLIVHEISGRLEGKTILRPIKLMTANPLLRKIR